MHLDRHRSLEVELSSGWNSVKDGELHVRAATAGLRLQTSETQAIEDSLEILKKSEAGIIRFGQMKSQSKSKIRIPFTLEHEVNDITLKFELSFSTENGTFFFAISSTVSIMLPLGVNVQDLFKHTALLSKFTISTSTPSPLRLLSSRLDGSEVFKADSGLGLKRPALIFPKQPATMLYKISKLPSPSLSPMSSRKAAKTSLSLVLHYICLEEEIENAVNTSLRQFFSDGPLHSYIRLVIPAVITELRVRLSPYDLERAAILGELSTSVICSVRWRDHFLGLGRTADQEIATKISEDIKTWQQQHTHILLRPMSVDEETLAKSRSIVIPVDIPPVTIVHTANLKLLEISGVVEDTTIATVNQPISALLSIKWTSIWDNDRQTESDRSLKPDFTEFSYEVSGASDTWLIGGRRKGHFRAPNNKRKIDGAHKLSFPVVLIPLREGFLPFPNVEIKSAPVAKTIRPGSTGAEEDPVQAAKQAAITCETDYKNAGETIRVISDAWKTTVSLDASGPQGGAWLLESEKRGHGSKVVTTV